MVEGSLLGFTLGFVSNYLAKLSYALISGFRYRKLLPLLHKLFEVADPLIKENLPHLNEHDLYELVRELAFGLGDGELSSKEIEKLVKMFFATFKVTLAAKAEVPVDQFGVDDVVSIARRAVSQFKAQKSSLS